VIRLDSTTGEALLHEPSDNTLLWDAVRVMVRLLHEADMSSAPGRRRHVLSRCERRELRS
jgi:IS5 family transposase